MKFVNFHMVQRFRYALGWLLSISIKIRINFCSAGVFRCCNSTDYARRQYRLTTPNIWPLDGTKSLLTIWYISQGLWMSSVHYHVHSSLSLCQINPIYNLTHRCFKVYCNQWRTEGGFGVFNIPPEIPKALQTSKIVPNSTRLWKLLKIAEFRTLTPQDVRKRH